MTAEIRYASSAAGDIAYAVSGAGPPDLLLLSSNFVGIDFLHEEPRWARFLERLSSFGRLIRFDRRGFGLSERLTPAAPTLEQWADDGMAALDDAGAARVHVFSIDPPSGQAAVLMAASYPERVASLCLFHAMARQTSAPDFPLGRSADSLAPRGADMAARMRSGQPALVLPPKLAADRAYVEWIVRSQRRSLSPSMLQLQSNVFRSSDVRAALPTIRVPTLVLRRPVARGPYDSPFGEQGRYLADHIPTARLIDLAGDEISAAFGDVEALVAEVQEFVTGARPVLEADRVLATVMFTDVVSSTETSAALGDRRWRELLGALKTESHREVSRHRGRIVNAIGLGDGILATFDGPARAVRCAQSVREAVRALGVEIRAGLHTGEIELSGDDITGMAVNIGSRVMSEAGPGEVVVSRTVVDLVAGSGLEFEDLGERELKGVPQSWRLFRVR